MAEINFAKTALYNEFMSPRNKTRVDASVRSEVWRQSGGKIGIDKQNRTDLELVMTTYFRENARVIEPNQAAQIAKLNAGLVKELAPKTLSAVEAYYHYMGMVTNSIPVMEAPKLVSMTGRNALTGGMERLSGSGITGMMTRQTTASTSKQQSGWIDWTAAAGLKTDEFGRPQ